MANTHNKTIPEIIFVCPDGRVKSAISRFIQKNATDTYPLFYVTAKQDVQKKGMCREILEKVQTNYDNI